MARYATTIASCLAPADSFMYMAHFDHALEWDPSVVEARRLDDGELGNGSTFRIVSTFAGRPVPLRYEITEFVAGRRVVLEAWNRSFSSVDTITIVAAGAASQVTYEARLIFKGISRIADPLMQLLLHRVGRKADASLRTHLNRSISRNDGLVGPVTGMRMVGNTLAPEAECLPMDAREHPH